MATVIDGTTGVSLVQDGVVVNADIVSVASSKVTGTTTNDNAAAGQVGEYVESVVAVGSAVSLVTNTAKTVTSISLAAGDWDVGGYISANASGSVLTAYAGSANARTTNALPSGNTDTTLHNCPASGPQQFTVPTCRVSLSGTTTLYLVAFATFASGTCVAYGRISARRVR